RGSTQKAGQPEPPWGGSPAHAGIDPGDPPGAPRASGLPRARGDRPALRSQPESTSPAPPRTRGSTPLPRFARSYASGSPAHAGIDPRLAYKASPDAWLPRARGDRPGASDVPDPHPAA